MECGVRKRGRSWPLQRPMLLFLASLATSQSFRAHAPAIQPRSEALCCTSPSAPSTSSFRGTSLADHRECVPELDAWEVLMDKRIEIVHGEPPSSDEVEFDRNVLLEVKELSHEAKQEISTYWTDELLPELDYMSESSKAKVMLGLEVAYIAHHGQLRKSGEPFIIHPVAVGRQLAQMKMDTETVMAGLLHDTVEDTFMTFQELESIFGVGVRKLVEGETKVSKLPKIALSNYPDQQAENLRQMFIAMTEDYRIIIVKLADRLHNMRTLTHMPERKQKTISRETLDIFAPLAHRLGIWQVKSELEDTAFRYLYPREYRSLKRRLRKRKDRFQGALEWTRDALISRVEADEMLKHQEAHVEVEGRMKNLYSLWTKMETREESTLDRIRDVVALRVVLHMEKREGELTQDWKKRGVSLCYHALGLVQHLNGCQPYPSLLKDYISFPKPNGYQSLHTAIMYQGQVVEVQIRTNWMHSMAEHGMASHWLYKEQQQQTFAGEGPSSRYMVPWLQSINTWNHEIKSSREFVEAIRKELLGARVFVFLRDGKILNLSRGATVIDSAFHIHAKVGMSVTEAFVNGQRVPLWYELQNGDVVWVDTTEDGSHTGRAEWLDFATQRDTKAKLREHLMLDASPGVAASSTQLVKGAKPPAPPAAAEQGKAVAVPKNEGPTEAPKWGPGVGFEPQSVRRSRRRRELAAPQEVKRAEANLDHLCKSCMPVRGDPIVGLASQALGAEVVVHRPTCPIVTNNPNVWDQVELHWRHWEDVSTLYQVEMQVDCIDRRFLLSDVSNVVSAEAEIFSTSSLTVGEKATIVYGVEVTDLEHLQRLYEKVKEVESVIDCHRVQSRHQAEGKALNPPPLPNN